MTDIELVRTITGNNEIDDAFISFYLQSSEEFIKAYCNINTIPAGLRTTYIEIAALKLNANVSGNKASLGTGVKSVGSITDGNQSISYASGSASKSFTSDEDFALAFGNILDRYRKMVGPNAEPLRTAGSRCLHTEHPHKNRARW